MQPTLSKPKLLIPTVLFITQASEMLSFAASLDFYFSINLMMAIY
jgi:hypothetical protein